MVERLNSLFAGPSILGGAFTTIVGTAFLLPCRMLLFQKLGPPELKLQFFSRVNHSFHHLTFLEGFGPVEPWTFDR